jgi:Tol biopolymer transport system component
MHSLYPHMQLAESSGGALVYVPGSDMSIAQFTWHARDGTTETLPLAAGVYGMFDLSDDGRRLAVQTADNRDYILIYELDRNNARRLATTDSAGWPKWSPTGDALAYTTFGENRPYRVIVQQLDSDRPPLTLAETVSRATPSTWSADGKLTYYEFPSNRIAVVDAPSGGVPAQPQYFNFAGSNHDVSPDGRWIVYSNASRGLDIRPLPADERVRRFSEVGVEPLWCRACDEIVYRIGNRWFANRLQPSDSGLEWEPARMLLQTDFIDSPGESWALSRDGQRILVLTSTATVSRTKMRVVSHWLPAAAQSQ